MGAAVIQKTEFAPEPGEFAPSDPYMELEDSAWSLAEAWLVKTLRSIYKPFRPLGGCWIILQNLQPEEGLSPYWVPIKTYVPWGETRLYRIMYEWFRGRVPEGCDLHHVCRVQGCYNPFHLVAMSRAKHDAWHRALKDDLNPYPSYY